ncbi:MAG: hypothetical protein ABIF11_00630 [Nitrospirota bacterium]
MKCSKCNYENKEDALCCNLCGFVFKKEVVKKISLILPPPKKNFYQGVTKRHLNLIIFVLLIIVSYKFCHTPKIKHLPEVLVTDQPVQIDIKEQEKFQIGKYTIKKLAQFRLKARVLSAKHYWMDRESALAPIDLALGWRMMSDTAVLEKLKISQNFRWYEYSWDENPPIPIEQIAENSANMHMIPSSSEIKKNLKKVHPGNLIEIEGFLVRVEDGKGWSWQSSMSRNDTEGGACEIVYVTKFLIFK